jgi:Uri superfamily endonuclease
MQQAARDRMPPSTFVPESKDVQRFKTNLRSRVSHALSRNSKSASTEILVGCSMDELRAHLESQFTDGMTWDNYGEWHVDHIKPCAMFDFSVDSHQFECFHYTNMQLTASEQVTELKDLGASEGDLASCKNQKQRKELFRKLTKSKYE